MRHDLRNLAVILPVVFLGFGFWLLRLGRIMHDWVAPVVFGVVGSVLILISVGIWLFMQSRRRAERRKRGGPLTLS
jgi:hypothetical protein